MSQEQWTSVDAYFDGLFAPPDDALENALKTSQDAGMPAISVAPNQGKLLYLLARSHRVKTILEIGTLGGYSTIWLARALPPEGRLITLELDPTYAAVAQANIEKANLAHIVDIRIGAAINTLPSLVNDPAAPFDLVFIDADKASSSEYLAWTLKLTRTGSVIILDNVARGGAVIDETSPDVSVQGTRKAFAAMANEPRLITTAIQTVGSKGYDGFAMALVVGS